MEGEVKCNQEACNVEFDNIKQRLDKMEEKEEKRTEEITVIKEAIVEIKTTNQQMAKVLEKLENKIDSPVLSPKKHILDTEGGKRIPLYVAITGILVILALAGEPVLEALKLIPVK